MNLIDSGLVKEGDKLWCDLVGECTVTQIDDSEILLQPNKKTFDFFVSIYPNGNYFEASPEICVLWPSKENRSWENVIPDMALVEAWDNDDDLYRALGFYNSRKKALFSQNFGYNNYKIIPKGKWPEWAEKAYKKIKDEC